jgi:nucleotide sugar dehydrogenase
MKWNHSKVGIVGLGFVGDAIRRNCEGVFNVICVDIDPNKSTGTYQDLLDCEAVFVCVPSPNKPNGDCDVSILNAVLYLLKDYKNVIISKTTAPPKAYEKLQQVYPNLVHVPEFLTAANAVRDFSSQSEVIIGGSVLAYQHEANRILSQIQPIKNVAYCSIGEAALTKYIVNSYLATKVVFMNEMNQLSAAHNYDWDRIRSMLRMDGRIGLSHTQVPGPDGLYGFGGHCFPKDTTTLVRFADKLGVGLSVLKSALKKNLMLRLQNSK